MATSWLLVLLLLRAQDGAELKAAEISVEKPETAPTHTWTLGEVLRTSPFWVVTLGHICVCFFWAGLNLHAVDFFALRGLTAADIASAMPVFTGSLIITSLTCGFFIDRVRNKLFVVGAATIAFALASVVAYSTHTLPRMMLFYTAYGVANGVLSVSNSVVLADLYGRHCLGAITSISVSSWTAASGVGPFLFGHTYGP